MGSQSQTISTPKQKKAFLTIEHVKTTWRISKSPLFQFQQIKLVTASLQFVEKIILKELDTSDGTSPQQTYARCGTPIEILVTECKEFVDRQNLRGNEATPNFYWLPKMHKTQQAVDLQHHLVHAQRNPYPNYLRHALSQSHNTSKNTVKAQPEIQGLTISGSQITP